MPTPFLAAWLPGVLHAVSARETDPPRPSRQRGGPQLGDRTGSDGPSLDERVIRNFRNSLFRHGRHGGWLSRCPIHAYEYHTWTHNPRFYSLMTPSYTGTDESTSEASLRSGKRSSLLVCANSGGGRPYSAGAPHSPYGTYGSMRSIGSVRSNMSGVRRFPTVLSRFFSSFGAV